MVRPVIKHEPVVPVIEQVFSGLRPTVNTTIREVLATSELVKLNCILDSLTTVEVMVGAAGTETSAVTNRFTPAP